MDYLCVIPMAEGMTGLPSTISNATTCAVLEYMDPEPPWIELHVMDKTEWCFR